MSECEKKNVTFEDGTTTFGTSKPYICTSSTNWRKNNQEARTRNQTLLQDLEHAKARLRTTASFTPTDHELYDRLVAYRRSLDYETPRSED